MTKPRATDWEQGGTERDDSTSELAADCRVTPLAIRFSEGQELSALRRLGEIRVFSRSDRARLELFLRGKRLAPKGVDPSRVARSDAA